ncbi:MAG: glycerophosphodiester phosphodiesterase family protein [Pseudomonadota bacterium]
MAPDRILGCNAFAHRGLWSPEGPPENSIAAFQAAAEAGLGIELDVQLSSDNVPVVFHDPMLDRMTESSGAVWHHTAEALTALSLSGSDQPIPTLTEALKHLPDGCPVLVELKPSPGDPAAYIRALHMAVFATGARLATMSFVKSINAALKAAALPYPRGLLLSPQGFHTPDVELAPDFLAPHHSQIGAARSAAGPGVPLAAWTIDNEATLATAKAANATVIFEHLDATLVLGP